MDSFEQDPRRQQELRGRPLVDQIYYDVFGENIHIYRAGEGLSLALDRGFGIDVAIRLLKHDQLLYGQEKFLSYKYSVYETVTVEHYQNPLISEEGDWFHLACQFYFCGYFTKDSSKLTPWVLLNWPNVVLATHRGEIFWRGNENQDGHAQASFKIASMATLPDYCVVASEGYEKVVWDNV